MYNPATVTNLEYIAAIKALGLADTSQVVKVSLRGFHLEYIAHPDAILTRPVPLHSLEPILGFLIPMAVKASGIDLTNLLISSGTFNPLELRHLVTLPRNPHARYEYTYPRLYLFLNRGSEFKDSLALSSPSIRTLLAPALQGRRQFFRLEHLPGLFALAQPTGTWVRNRHLLTGEPLKAILHSSPPSSREDSKSQPSEAMSSCTDSSAPFSEPIDTVVVKDAVFQMIHQQQQYTQNQELLLQNSFTMVAILKDLSDSLKAKAPGFQGAVTD